MWRASVVAGLGALLAIQTGCIVSLGDIKQAARVAMQRCAVESQPPGASIHINGKHVGETPCEVARPLGDAGRSDFQIAASLEGHRSASRDFKDFPTHVVFELQPLPKRDDLNRVISDCDLHDLPAPAELRSVAVLDFRVDEETPPSVGETLADFCREAIQDSRRLILVDREHMRTLLTEEDFAATVDCDDTRCLIDFGRKLRAQLIIHGRASRVGDTRVLTLKMMDVASAEVVAIRNATTWGTPEDFLDLTRPTTCELLHDALSENSD